MARRLASHLCLLASLFPAPAALAQESAPVQAPSSAAWTRFLDSHEAEYLKLYRQLHAHPELSFQEEKAAVAMADALRAAGFEVTTGVGGHGVVGVLRHGQGPTVLVRADMDALPLAEKTGLPYASAAVGKGDDGQEVPVMHACGHDMHMAVWAGTARYLASVADRWQGTLLFIAQPAEERGAGAKAMLGDQLFQRFPKPDYCLALHVKGDLAAGTVGLCSGYALGNVDSVDILVHGQGGHGSTPHLTHDPVVLAARIVLALQTIVSREVPPVEDAVITVGSIHGGLKHNVIPDEVKMQLTVRSYQPEIRRLLLEGIARNARGEAIAAGFPESLMPEVRVHEEEFTPATYNDPALTVRLKKVFQSQFGQEQVLTVPAVMGGEDFGRYGPAAGCPSTLFWLGTASPAAIRAWQEQGVPLASTHQSHFAPDLQPTWRTGVQAMSAAVLELLKKQD